MNFLGLDIGGTAVKIGIISEIGEIICQESYNVAFDEYETPILETVLQSVDEFLKRHKYSINEIKGIGISATGQIDTYQGSVIGVGGNIKHWEGTNLKETFETKYHKKTTVVNDANCVVLGEQWIGGAKGKKNVIVVTIGTGVGGGILVDSEVLLGNVGIAGELGHFSIQKDGRLCTCGNYGCYEQYASITALVKEVREHLTEIGVESLASEDVNGKVIFELLENGNRVVNQLVDQWMDYIATGLISLTHIFNPELILIGGGVSVQEKLFVSKVRQKVLDGVMIRFREHLEVKAAELGNGAGMVGAVYYCIKH